MEKVLHKSLLKEADMKVKVWFLLSLTIIGMTVVVLASNLESVTFRLNWISAGEGDHAPFYVAQDLGFYKDAGLNVTIQKGSGSADAVKLVDVGRVDIGLADFTSIAVARARGAAVKIVAQYQINSPNTIWSRKDLGISSPKDLAGHTIGSPAGDAQRVAFPAFAKAVGLDPNSVNWVNISPGAKVQSLASGTVDATVHFIDQLYLYQQAIGKDNLVYFRWADYGVNPYGLAIIVNENTLANRPQMISRFLDATFRGVRWTIQHPDEAITIMQKYVPAVEIKPVLAMLQVSIKYLMYDNSVLEHGLGYIDVKRMQSSVNLVNEYFNLPRKLTASELYTDSLLPHYAWPYPSEMKDPAAWPLPYKFSF